MPERVVHFQRFQPLPFRDTCFSTHEVMICSSKWLCLKEYLHTVVYTIEVGDYEQDESLLKEWRHHSIKTRSKLKFPADAAPWTQSAPEHLKQQFSAREQDVIDVSELVRQRAGIPVSSWFIDMSQGVQFQPWGALGTCCTSSRVFDLGSGRLLNFGDHLAVLGYPVPERIAFYKDCVCYHYSVERNVLFQLCKPQV